MSLRTTNLSAEHPFDVLRRTAVEDPAAAGAYGRLAGQHFGAFPVARLRAMLRWVRALAGDRPVLAQYDERFARLEAAQSARARRLESAASVHTVVVGSTPVRLVADDPASYRFVQANLIEQWPYEPGVTRYLLQRLRRDDVFVDVGAHAGFFSLIACSRGAVAFAVEPQRDLVWVIERNAHLNRADRLHALHLALSDHEGLVGMFRFIGSPGMQLHGEIDAPRQATAQHRHVDWIPTTRLDSLFVDSDVQPDVVKIDIEGLEMRVLAGAAALIAANRTAFVVELHPHLMSKFGGRVEALAELFGAPGWRVLDLSGDQPAPVTLAEGIARAAAGTVEEEGRVTLAFEPAGWQRISS